MKKIILYTLSATSILLLIFACEDAGYSSNDTAGNETGTGGSMARFTIANNRLYAVDHQSLKTFDITNESTPSYRDSVYLSNDIETIFPFGNTLFIGSQNGMYIYDINSPDNPRKLSSYQHITSCDPVVTDGNYAFVTLNSLNSWCGNWVNELHVVNVQNLSSPRLERSYSMSGPRGLALKNEYLYVCDDGLKVFDRTNVNNIVQLAHFNDIQAYDVIPDDDRIIVIGEDGFYQYRFDGSNLTLLSKIEVSPVN
jgi:hypothetical protein